MKIINVTPGLIPIPPNGWGAVEKIIWEYHLNIKNKNIESEILYLDEVKYKSGDIVHIHVANLALLAHERGIPYFFTCHDHHAYLYGKNSEVYRQNYEAIKHSVKSFVPAKYLVKYFDLPNVEYISHGVNINYFKPNNNVSTSHKLLCVANNGFIHDPSEDRKGFLFAIEAAKSLNLPITIAGPNNNKKFFEKNNPSYEKLNILYNLNEDELLNVYKEHTIFLHPSVLEAGHPNLTLLEAMSCGLPVVGTFEENNSLAGLYKIERNDLSVINGVKHVINHYEEFRTDSLNTAKNKSWSNVVDILIQKYKEEFNMKTQLTNIYDETIIVHKESLTAKNTINISFEEGCKVEILGSEDREYHVKFINSNTKNLVYDSHIKTNMWCMPDIKYFVKWQIEILDKIANEIIVCNLDLNNKKVKIINDSPSLGDFISWIPYIDEFQKTHNCELHLYTPHTDLFSSIYDNIKFLPYNHVVDEKYYATYKLGCFINDSERKHSPKDYRTQSLQQIAAEILGFKYTEILPKKLKAVKKSEFNKKYVCIAVQSTSQCKYWNESGWQQVVDYLNSLNYNVVCIDRHPSYGKDTMNNIPKNCIDKTGDYSLQDRIDDISNCEFFIGLSSGLSWLAWACHKPVVMISGFTKSFNEFNNPYRVINESVCNGCWNNTNYLFDLGNWYWCPTNKNFECSKKITFEMVKSKIDLLIDNQSNKNIKNNSNPFNYREIFEWNQYERFVTVDKCDTVLDLGCSNGLFYIKNKDKNIKYIGVDASIDSLSDFIENLNGDTSPVLLNSLISDTISVENCKSMFHDTSYKKTISVTFENLIKLLNVKIDFLKFDIEGYEKLIFDDNYDIFKSYIKKFSGEYHFLGTHFPRNIGYELLRKLQNDKDLTIKLFSVDGIDITNYFWTNPDYYSEIILCGINNKL